jgi:hypothetical protein
MTMLEARESKRPWQHMRLDYIGHIADVIQGGGGKLSIPSDDTGDILRKPKGLDPGVS